MTVSPDTIASRLETRFERVGFASPGVDALRDAAGVSLRTLYKYFPSREDMVIAALEARHRRYLARLTEDLPGPRGTDVIVAVLDRAADWLRDSAPSGCLFLGALAAYPDSVAIQDQVARHKTETRAVLRDAVSRAKPALAEDRMETAVDGLFLIHEGMAAASRSQGPDMARDSALALARALLKEEDDG